MGGNTPQPPPPLGYLLSTSSVDELFLHVLLNTMPKGIGSAGSIFGCVIGVTGSYVGRIVVVYIINEMRRNYQDMPSEPKLV